MRKGPFPGGSPRKSWVDTPYLCIPVSILGSNHMAGWVHDRYTCPCGHMWVLSGLMGAGHEERAISGWFP